MKNNVDFWFNMWYNIHIDSKSLLKENEKNEKRNY